MMDPPSKSRSRRQEIRKNRPDAHWLDWEKLKASGAPASLAIAGSFFLIAFAILQLRQDVPPYRPNQPINHDIVARVGFSYLDQKRYDDKKREAGEREPRVYEAVEDAWPALKRELLALPNSVAASTEPPAELKDLLDAGALTALRNAAAGDGASVYAQSVDAFVESLHQSEPPLIVLADSDRDEDVNARRRIRIGTEAIDPARTVGLAQKEELRRRIAPLAAQAFTASLQSKIAEITLVKLQPTHRYDDATTTQRKNQAREAVPMEVGRRYYTANEILVHKSKQELDQQDWMLLKAEHEKYVASLSNAGWMPIAGTGCLVLIVTVILSAYIKLFQPRVAKNHARALSVAALLLAMLLLAQLAGVGNVPIYAFGIGPTVLAAMILAIAYDRRFAIGVASIHGLLVTIALSQSATFFAIIWIGVLTCCFLLEDIRTRSKLIEVGGAGSLAMMACTAASGLLSLEPPKFILVNSLYAGAAGLAVGFIVLGILPFIEKMFKITTSMTLLELADVSQPLLRRLHAEAPGTYAHSMQVASLAEAAAEAIGANALQARVGSYYHDVGKMNKADYFIENQAGGANRHLNLTPNVSLLIIIGHVKDGVELAREYNLPPSIIPYIQQHHGTTLVEYFYDKACTQRPSDEREISETEYRYPGPKPRSKEVAIVMLADAVESACRCMTDPNAGRIEALVHDLAMKRLADGQFEECDLTLRELELIERSLMKTLVGIYHGRIPYRSTRQTTEMPSADATQPQPVAPARSA